MMWFQRPFERHVNLTVFLTFFISCLQAMTRLRKPSASRMAFLKAKAEEAAQFDNLKVAYSQDHVWQQMGCAWWNIGANHFNGLFVCRFLYFVHWRNNRVLNLLAVILHVGCCVSDMIATKNRSGWKLLTSGWHRLMVSRRPSPTALACGIKPATS